MTPLRFLVLITALFSIVMPAHALQVKSRAIANKQIYAIQFPGDARAYYGRANTIQSISKQEYVTSAFRVVEVNIITNGPALLRIYHSRPLKAAEIQGTLGNAAGATRLPGSTLIQSPLPQSVRGGADKVAEVADSITGSEVIKDYPIATHAHTIEFRVGSRNELLELYDELKKHWLKEPTYFENGQIVGSDGNPGGELKPRSLGGTIFNVEN